MRFKVAIVLLLMILSTTVSQRIQEVKEMQFAQGIAQVHAMLHRPQTVFPMPHWIYNIQIKYMPDY